MCLDPVTIGLGVASFAASAMSGAAEYSARQTQYATQKQSYYRNEAQSLAAGNDEYNAIQRRTIQEGKAYAQRDREQLLEGARKGAEASAAAAGSGVTGLSVDNLVADVGRRVDANRTTLEDNWNGTALQLQDQSRAATTKITSRIGQVAMPVEPDPTGAVLGVVGSGLKIGGGLYAKAM